jgi:hypothetical protein
MNCLFMLSSKNNYKILLENNINVNQVDIYGRNCLFYEAS